MSTGTAITNDDLQCFADGLSSPARRAEVAAYLELHPEAAAYVARIVEQNARLRAAAAPYLAPEIPSHLRVSHLLQRERPTRRLRSWAFGSWGPGSWGFSSWEGIRPQIAASLVAGLLVGGIGGWAVHPSVPPFTHGVRPLVEETADAYAVYEPDRLHPVEIAARDKDGLMRWVTDRLRRPISAPDTLGPYRLMGGRIIATTRGPAAMFMYTDDAGRRIVLMICPLSLHTDVPIEASAQGGGLIGVSWSNQGVGYSLVGTLPRGEMEKLGEDVRRKTADKA